MAESRLVSNFVFTQLNRNNYRTWKSDIVCHLEQEGVAKWINRKTQLQLPDNASFSDNLRWESLKEKALGIIKASCDRETRQIVQDLDDPAEAWDALNKAFESSSRARKAHMLTEYMNVKLITDEPMSVFIARFEAAYRRVVEAGESINEQQRCYQLIRYLPDTYDGLVRELYEYDDDNFTFSKIKERLLNEYGRMAIKDEERISQDSFMTSSNQKKKYPVRTVNAPKGPKCYKCYQYGHIARNCPTTEKESNVRRSPDVKNQDKKENNYKKGISFLAEIQSTYEESYAEEEQLTRDWTIDSATTSHISQNPEFFVEIKPAPDKSFVRMGVTPHKVHGIGLVRFQVKDRGKLRDLELKNVLYVPSINRNLISVTKMEDAGFHAKLDRGIKIYSSRWNYILTARRESRFYILKGIPERSDGREVCSRIKNEQHSFVTESNFLMKWHERYGHCGLSILRQMSDKEMTIGLDKLTGDETVCEYCQLAKSKRSSHPRMQEIRSKSLLQLVHADVWGPAPVASLAGYRYVLTFIDDYSRRSFCFPLKTKDEVFLKCKEFIVMVERQTNKKICALRTDNGLEFCNQKLNSLFRNLGIKHEHTNVYSPQMNGVAERYNRTLLEGVRAHLQVTKLPSYHWIEAVMSTNYLRNRTLHSTTKEIPFKRWYGRKPNVKHFRKLGCIAYVHQVKDKRNKFEARAKKGVMVGYALGTRGYRVWYPDENIIVESRHVTFDESKLGSNDGRNNIYSTELLKTTHLSNWDLDWNESSVPIDRRERLLSTEERTVQESTEDIDEIQVDGQATMSDSSLSNGSITFQRSWNERQTGKSAGRCDIYYKTSDGSTLRSKNDVKKFCQDKNLNCDISKFNFSTNDKTTHSISVKHIEDKEEDTNDDEAECACGELLAEVYCTDVIIPKTAKQAFALPEADKWKKAMDEEIATMEERKVWKFVSKPIEAKVIGSKWVYSLKKNAEGHIASFKARLVALGNSQCEGRDYDETYSPVVNFTLIRLFIILFTVILGWSHCLLDVKCAYLYGNVDKVQYMRQPAGYEVKGKGNYVLQLDKALYGLHQSGRCWYNELHEKLLEIGFKPIPGMVCVYHYKGKAIIQVYVDDIPVYACDDKQLEEVVSLIKSIYEVRNLGPIKQLLGVQFNASNRCAFINQTDYITKCVKKFNCDLFTKTYVPMSPGVMPSSIECPKSVEEI